MGIFSKFGSWAKKTAGKVGSFAKDNVGALVGVASLAAGFIPGVGPLLSKGVDAVGNKVKKVSGIFGIGDGKPGIMGIGDKLPGIFGIGTGKAAANRTREGIEALEAIKAKINSGEPLTVQEAAAHKAAQSDMKKDGVNPLYLLGGGLLAFFALNRK